LKYLRSESIKFEEAINQFLNPLLSRYIGTVGINAELDELEVSNLDISVFVMFCVQVS